MDIYLMRHGESFSNMLDLETAGPEDTDAELTPAGHQQAQAAARWLASHLEGINAIYASTMLRTQQTAGYIAEALSLPIQSDDRLREVTTCYEDHTPIERSQLPVGWHPFSWSDYPHRSIADDQSGRPVESWAALRKRVGHFFNDLVARTDQQQVVVVAHGGVINATVDMVFNVGIRRHADVRNEYTAISRLTYNGDGSYAPWFVHFLAQASHLDGNVSHD